MIKAIDIYKSYGDVHVLKGIDLEIKNGEVIAIVGASGAGKSTLLHILGALDVADRGEVIVSGENLKTLRRNQLAEFRNKNIGFVFQFHHLLPEFTALENVSIPAFIAGKGKKETEKKAMELFDYLKVSHRVTHKPNELSGGEQQRVAVARALINNPKVVFADEPSGNLDSQNAQELHELFFKLRKEFDQTFVIATHNEKLAAMSDRLLRMKDGKIIEEAM